MNKKIIIASALLLAMASSVFGASLSDVMSAIKAGNYTAWKAAVGNHPMTKIVNESNFPTYVKLVKFEEDDNVTEAAKLRAVLGIGRIKKAVKGDSTTTTAIATSATPTSTATTTPPVIKPVKKCVCTSKCGTACGTACAKTCKLNKSATCVSKCVATCKGKCTDKGKTTCECKKK